MSEDFLPIVRDSDNDFFVIMEKKPLSNQINIYKKNEDGRYEFLGPSSQNRDYENEIEFKPDTYYVNKADKNLLFGGNKTKRRQYRYRSSSKKRVASHRRGRGRQTKYSRRK